VYPIATKANGATNVVAPETDFTADVDAILKLVSPRTKLVWLANPNNPTGTYLPFDEVKRLRAGLPSHVLLVIDAAYSDYVSRNDYEIGLELVATTDNTVMTHTFSKIHGLAGLRVGYLIADPGIITTLRKIRAPFSVGTLAQAGALAALGDPGHAAQVRARTLRARAELTRLFEHAGYRVIPSQANFVLVQAPDEHALVSRLAEHAIAVRPGTALGIPGTVRVSVPSQRGLRLLHSALRPTSGRPGQCPPHTISGTGGFGA